MFSLTSKIIIALLFVHLIPPHVRVDDVTEVGVSGAFGHKRKQACVRCRGEKVGRWRRRDRGLGCVSNMFLADIFAR